MEVPTYYSMMNPLLKAIHELGGSGTIEEIDTKVIEIMDLPEEIFKTPHGEKSSKSEVEYRLAWTKTYLKKYGLLENSSRGIWVLTNVKDKPTEVDPQDVVKKVHTMESNKKSRKADESSPELNESEEELQNWKDDLLNLILEIEPLQFERLAQRLLRESGFTQVEVTSKSADCGIDGKGIDLIDGNDLVEKLKYLSLGVNTEMIEKVSINVEWFKNI
jgi:restriction system protein